MFNTIFNSIGSVMTTIVCYVIAILPLGTPEDKEALKQSVKAQSGTVGMISLIAMLLAIFVLPMIFPKWFKKQFTKAKRTYRKARKRMRRRK